MINEKEFKLIEQYWNELEKGNTNMGYEAWKLTKKINLDQYRRRQ